MDNTERILDSACGSIALEGFTVPKSVRDSMRRCLNDEALFDFAVVYVAGARAGYRSFHKTAVDDDDPYCYQYSCTLVNRLNIRDGDVLSAKIRDVSALRLAELMSEPPLQEPDLDMLKHIHRRLFGDIFSWAGEFRTTYTDDPLICRPEYIGTWCEQIMYELRKTNYLSNLGKEELIDRLAHYMCEFHMAMPFRIGSDLTARALLDLIATMNGYYLDFSKTCSSLMDVALRFAVSDESQMRDIIASVITEFY